MAATGLIVLIACANLANLLLARATAREPEIAVRLALGASRGRLLRQLLIESLQLAIAGTLAGWILARVLSRALVAYISPPGNSLFIDVQPDLNVLVYSAALSVMTCALFGLVPALRASYLSPVAAMRGGARSLTSGRDRFNMRRALVVTQVALSLVLLFGASLFVGTYRNLLSTDLGFQTEGLMVATVGLEKIHAAEDRGLRTYRELREKLAALPGAISVARVAFSPITGSSWNNTVAAENGVAEGSGNLAFFNVVTPGYFETMKTRLIAGRDFEERDRVGSPPVAIVNEAFGAKLFAGKNPVGHTFHMAGQAGHPEPSFQIVGLVANAMYREVREGFRPTAYFPANQDEHPGDESFFLIRMSGPPNRVTAGVIAAAAATNPLIGVGLHPLSDQVRDSLLRESLMATLSGGFGFLAVSLAALGLYGVIAYMIARRANEIGIRIALGADRGQVIRMVLREAAVLLLVGTAAGIPFALWAGKTAAALLFGLEPRDAASLLGAAALLGIIGLLASYVPARRAGALDPAEALRNA